MNAIINHPAESLFVDQPNVNIPIATQAIRAETQPSLRSARPFSDMGQGKFRRLFNRHTAAFRR